MQAPEIFVALENSGFAAAIRQSPWAYMLANIGHIVGLAVLAGSVAIMDLRMAGLLRATNPAVVLRNARTAAACALAIQIITGSILFSAEAAHVIVNPVFLLKVGLIVLGLLNVAWFEYFVAPAVRRTPANRDLPDAARISGIASIAIWACVAICGRSIAYF